MVDDFLNSKKNKENARICLLQAASKLFAKFGFEKTSTRDIAQDSKVNISMISYHFGGKDGLYKQVLTDFAQEVKKSSSEILKNFNQKSVTRESFYSEMTLIIDHMIQTRIKNPEICTLLARDKIEGMPLSLKINEELFHPLVIQFLEMMERAQKNKIIRNDINPKLFFILLTEGLWGFFEVAKCKTKLSENVEDLVKDSIELRNQILKIYLEGVLL